LSKNQNQNKMFLKIYGDEMKPMKSWKIHLENLLCTYEDDKEIILYRNLSTNSCKDSGGLFFLIFLVRFFILDTSQKSLQKVYIF